MKKKTLFLKREHIKLTCAVYFSIITKTQQIRLLGTDIYLIWLSFTRQKEHWTTF